ncbi:aldehyde dehydrogenase family protein [Paraburkholderia ferrariae]|uniref:Aldehyde dehydrogenase family protein n=1 Tax=Paraburkholderia ferrariae TaxID=386056 RepID=A0ABU9RM82_9BURK
MSQKQDVEKLLETLGLPRDAGSFVDGKFVSGEGGAIEIRDPVTGAVAYSFADADQGLIDLVSKSSLSGLRKWQALSARDRAKVLRAIAIAVGNAAEDLAQLESITSGKIIKGSRAQLALVVDMLEYYAGWADKFTGDVIPVPGGQLNYTVREPLGVILQVTPWNSPLYLAVWNAAPALAMGNAVLLKPSELTPLTALAFAKIAVEAGLPPGVLNVVGGYGQSTVQPLIQREEVKKVVFVGSTATGRKVAAQAAARPIPCLLELGGKSANIVFADADLERAAEAALVAGYANTGQNCAAGSRLLVQKTVYDQFIALLESKLGAYRIGSPLDENIEIGPVNNELQLRRITEMVSRGIAEGARCISGNAVPDNGGYFVSPTILADATNEMSVAREEIFGPVIVAIPFDEEAEAVAIANDSEFGLAGAVWTRDIARGHRVASKVNAGLFWINMYREMHVSSPFGGNDSSGYGRSSGVESLYEYTRTKSVWLPTEEGS